MTARESCPICGEGHVTTHEEKVVHDYNGTVGEVKRLYQCCDACGSEFSGAAEAKQNKRCIIEFRKRVDGLLTGKEVAAIRTRLDLKKNEAAKLFGGGPVAFSKYESDDVAQSVAMDRLLRIVAAVPEAFEALKALASSDTAPMVVTLHSTSFSEVSKPVEVYNPKEFRREPEERMKVWR